MKQLIAIVSCVCVLASTIAAQQITTSAAEVSISFVGRTIYYPGDSPSEPITVEVTITNKGPQTYRFKMADDYFFSFDFSAVTTRNQNLDHTALWLRKRNASTQVYFREISIESGESYSFRQNVKDYIAFTNPGMYILECLFFPELKRLTGITEPFIRSNRLTIEVKPSPSAAAVKLLPISPITAEVLQPKRMPPDEVVTYVLTSRQRSFWDQFFLYFDVERMLMRDPAKSRRYRAESEAGRISMIETYKTELTGATVDKEIAVIPVDFSIEKTTYTETEGSVVVIQWFEYKGFREIKRFTYYLSNRDNIWRIYDYTVENLGTEEKK